MPKFFNMFVGPLASLFAIGMFLPRCTARSAIPAVLVSFSLSVVWSWWTEIFGTTIRPTFLLAIAAPYVTSLATAIILSRIVEKPGEEHGGAKYNWWAVTSQPENPEAAVEPA
jgi:SSS family solute:Na+ symporter